MIDQTLERTWNGNELLEAIESTSEERKAIIENFLYEKSALLLYADDGEGKSVLLLQSLMQSTVADSKVFGEFLVPKEHNVLLFQMERSIDESLERMKHLKTVIPFNPDNFCLSVALQGTNLQDNSSLLNALDIVHTITLGLSFKPDIIAFDPIYTLAQEDLSSAKACNAITNFFRLVQLKHECSIMATSHTNRGVRDPENPGKRVGKDMYGNRFLSAFFTGSYHISQEKDGEGATFNLDKNSQKNLEKKFKLVYDPSCYRSWITESNTTSKKDLLDNYLKTCKMSNKTFTTADMLAVSKVSDSTLRGYLAGYLREKLETVSILKQGKKLYRFIG